ncbi:ABC transporter ATP-binding protein [Verticiella sediminum]|uniref:ABC transporter ATP-binding protein n=2 Tax=Verticiella sediminum TaxID=1247510 RepID=A0A556AQC5_9BURK|nr:ABC transporter ATP-binding protein [Verticiella sediminum]
MSDTVLDVQKLSVSFATAKGTIQPVRDVSFALKRRETLALVGESGSGKSVASLTLMRLISRSAGCAISGSARLTAGEQSLDLLNDDIRKISSVRGDRISMIFQEPMTSLNPVHRIGDQIGEALYFHRNLSRKERGEKVLHLLDQVGIVNPARTARDYPHHLSGGMRQRVMIAMAIACDPDVLIADEPTTALDVTIQAQILDLLRKLQEVNNMAMVFITHNLGVVAEIADRVMVMYCGQVVEDASVMDLFRRPLMPYTQGLLSSIPAISLSDERPKLYSIPGNVPDLAKLPSGCAFAPRCRYVTESLCTAREPEVELATPTRRVRCLNWRTINNVDDGESNEA